MDMTAGGWPVKMVEKMEGFDAAFDDFLKHASMVLTDHMTKQYPTLRMPTLKAQEGGRYMKIVKEDGSTSRSVWAFVDKTNGDVLKPAGWNAPAKNARANVFDRASWRNVGAYGPAYMRNMAASELVRIAKELMAMDPETKEEIKEQEKYDALSMKIDKEMNKVDALALEVTKIGKSDKWDAEIADGLQKVVVALGQVSEMMDEMRIVAANW